MNFLDNMRYRISTFSIAEKIIIERDKTEIIDFLVLKNWRNTERGITELDRQNCRKVSLILVS